MKMKKIMVLVVLMAIMLMFSACRARNETQGGTDREAGTRIVTDIWGREVEIPQVVRSIITLGSGAPRIGA